MIQILIEGLTSSPISIFLAASVNSLIFSFSYETVGMIERMAFSRLGICTATSLIFRSHIFWKRDRPLLGCYYTACQSWAWNFCQPASAWKGKYPWPIRCYLSLQCYCTNRWQSEAPPPWVSLPQGRRPLSAECSLGVCQNRRSNVSCQRKRMTSVRSAASCGQVLRDTIRTHGNVIFSIIDWANSTETINFTLPMIYASSHPSSTS